MIPEKMLEVMKHEGVVAIVTQGDGEPHVVNTWNSYLKVSDNGSLLVPVGGMKTTESNIDKDNKVQVTLGSREVEGIHYMGTGFFIRGTARFIFEGNEFDEIQEKFTWIRAVLEITPESIAQTL